MRRLCWFLAFATGLLMFDPDLHAQGERFVFALTREGQVYGIADFDVAKFMDPVRRTPDRVSDPSGRCKV